MQKNKILYIVVGVVAIIILASTAFFIFLNKPKAKPAATNYSPADSNVQTLAADDIGLDLKASADSKKVQITISKLSGIKAVSYELTYEADSTAEEISQGGEARIQRGITGDAKFNAGDTSYNSPWLDLGSCSKNICRYDQGVTSVDLILKITKDNNQVYSTEKKLSL